MRVLLLDQQVDQQDESTPSELNHDLSQYGFEVVTVPDNDAVVEYVSETRADVLVLNLAQSSLDVAEIYRSIRAVSELPLIMLIAADCPHDSADCLNIGADDALIVPFKMRELAARINAVVRRRSTALRLIQEDRELLSKMEELVQTVEENARKSFIGLPEGSLPVTSGDPEGRGVVAFGPIHLNLDTAKAFFHQTELDLTKAELRLLSVFLSRPGQVCTRTELIDALWGEYSSDNISKLEYVVRQLREKVEVDPAAPRYIVAIPGIGYQLG